MNNQNEYYNYYDYNRKEKINENKYMIENDPYTAFVKGNSYPNLYNQYLNYKPYNLNPENEQAYQLLLVQIYGFVAHDLGLYLDVFPNDDKAIQLREKYETMCKQALMEYEQKYGPLNLSSDMLGTVPWTWSTKSFPWEVDK